MKVLMVVLCVLVVGMGVNAETPVEVPAPMRTFETVKLSEGVYAFVSPESNGAMVTGNSLVVIGDDGVLVVDSGHFPSVTAKQIAQIKQWTDKPVRWLVNTHWHPDHNAGNGLYLKTWPGVQIVSTAATRDGIMNVLPKKEVDEAQIEQMVGISKKGTYPDGKPLSEKDKRYFDMVAVELEAFRPELKAAQHVAPTTTFKDEMSVWLGKREVRVLFLGRGNTAGDAVVYVPDAKLVASGDLIVYPVPYPFGSFIGEWIGTLKKLDALAATTILPGHGPVLRDHGYLKMNIALLEETMKQTEAQCKQAGMTAEEALKHVDVSKLRPGFVGENKDRGYFFDNGYLRTAVGRACREAKEGALGDEN
jgi:cyclase